MVTLLISSFLIIGLIAVFLYFWQKPNQPAETDLLPPPPEPRGLFAPEDSKKTNSVGKQALPEERRAEILRLAQSGTKSALDEAYKAKDDSLYDEVLSRLAAAAEGPQLLSLVSYVSRNNLRVTNSLADRFIESWKTAPTRNSTAEMLHIAALSNDARTYTGAVEAAMQCWRDGNLNDVSAVELRSLIEGEFWIISSRERSSGAGFSLKQTLADVRRELDVAARAESTLPTLSN
jgi:hypothetical protein